MHDKESSMSIKIGLRKLTDEDLQVLSEEIFEIIQELLSLNVDKHKIDSYEVVIDLDNSTDDLQIDIDIISSLTSKDVIAEEKMIQEIIHNAFLQTERLLKEKYS